MITAVIIDSGISDKFIKSDFKIKGLSFSFLGDEIKAGNDCSDTIGHGTAVTDILTSYKYSDEVQFVMIKIFEDTEECDEDLLLYALKYIYENIKCDIIHISSGIIACGNETRLEKECDMMLESGIIIVSAFDNLGGISFPAAFESVIGVDYNFESGKNFSFDYIENSIVNISARHCEQRLMWKDGKRKVLQGNSFIAPHITAMIIEYLCRNKNADRNDVLEYLKSKAKNVYSEKKADIDRRISPFDIKKSCIFPFNKEVQTIARFDGRLDFEILHYYDSKYLGNCGRKISSILENTETNATVENIENINWCEDFDTFILGHTDKINRLLDKNYADEIIKSCLDNNKNLFVFDDLNLTDEIIQSFIDKGLNIYFPSVNNKDHSAQAGKLYSFAAPILAVFGTSSKQGKFTLQLNIKRVLSERGYDIGFLGTEPTAYLLDADEDYVAGYNSDIYKDPTNNIIRLNSLIHNIARKQKDLILLGSQSHTVPVAYSNIGMLPLYQQDILFAAPPDACILCVNFYDDISYIKRNIDYLESICETKVILLCISKFGGSSRWTTYGTGKSEIDDEQVAEGRKKITAAFDIPVYMYDEYKAICDKVIDYFSEE